MFLSVIVQESIQTKMDQHFTSKKGSQVLE